MKTAIETHDLRKAFAGEIVLDGIDLEVPRGSIFALLGPNGAGKTTTVKILTTLISADGGTAHVGGHDVVSEADAVRAAIGVTGQFSAVDGLMTGRENLRLMADLHHLGRSGRARVGELLERFELSVAADRPASTYSGGMRRRLDLAMSLIGDPQIIFLDEPTTGLDPAGRRAVWDAVRGLVAGGASIFLTTQYLEEADQLADRIAVLDGGRIVAEGTPAELKRRVPGASVQLRFAEPAMLERAARAVIAPDVTRDDPGLTLSVPSGGDVAGLRELLGTLERDGVEVAALELHTPDLDDVFLAVTGRVA